ncbi:SbcC/MukB-like Walker B domain-containing protein [Micromonospora antibiotica]|uniref:TIGR02680 family protein n=1 Tax=Micromonospora antibiotica TaxID=2807623 RepID=A0ABS3V6R3_9ACTN|nr:SbcC/MukB-like Walker B domain-containing protein [Micromonospora antibiotica]MBO4161222.1 hypothetical protein [Micromonospora antibiotica]
MAVGDAPLLFGDELIEPAGHPERFTGRWRLVGAGLSNVWRYGDLQLDAASGRLLLRGPNGTGKTTALEALWPYLLDLNPQRLAAGKARPTSLSLLMREGAGGSRRRCGYLWLTLAAPADEGIHSYGVRLLFSESSSPAVRVLPFTVPGLPLHDVPLYGPGRAFLSDEQFRDVITGAGGTVFADEDAYVGNLATRLWRASERELIELANRVRAVRNPTLLGDVSPQAAAHALRDALPGVSDDVVAATAEALAESEATRTAFQRDRNAASALERFAEAWAGHVVDVVGATHKSVTDAMDAVDDAERKQRRASRNLDAAQEVQSRAAAKLDIVKKNAAQLDADVRALENSEPYKAAGRLGDLQARVEAEQGRAADALSGFRAAVDASRTRAGSLAATAAEILADIDNLADTASATDPQARPEQPVLTQTSRSRQPYPVGDQTVDPGPGAVVAVEKHRIEETAERWRALAAGHQTNGDQARLALTDRQETDCAEREAKRTATAAATARVQADREQQRLAGATNEARHAVITLLDGVNGWYTEYGKLETVVADARRNDVRDDGSWQAIDLNSLTADEPARTLADIDGIATLVTRAGEAAIAAIRLRVGTAVEEAKRLRLDAENLRAEGRQLRAGKLLPIPRPDWAGPAAEGQSFADAIEWHHSVTDPTKRALIENAMAVSGLLGASLQQDSVRTSAWHVEASGDLAEPSLAAVLVADPTHPDAVAADHVLRRIPLRDTCDPTIGPTGLVIGRDGTFSAGPLHGRPPGSHDPALLRPAEYIGAAQRRAAARKWADELDTQAGLLESEARRHDETAGHLASDADSIARAMRAFPPRVAAHAAEAARAVAATRVADARQEATDAEQKAAEQAETARALRLEWEQRTRTRGLPIEIDQLGSLRDNGERRAKELRKLATQLTDRFGARLARLIADVDDDRERNERLRQHHADTATTVQRAERSAADHRALVQAVGLEARAAVSKHAEVVAEREVLAGEMIRMRQEATDAQDAVRRRGFDLEQAQQRATDARPPVTAALRQLRTLLEVDGVPAVLFASGTVPSPADADTVIAAVGQALPGRRTTSRRILRERYDSCRAELAGLWTLDPGDTVDNLDTYHLTHDSIGYTPPTAADAGLRLRDRAQAALDRAEESALREFVIGRLPLAIGTAWVSIEDWVKDVNRKMQKAAASSGVGVRIAKSLAKDLSAAELTVHRLACKGSVLTADQQAEVGEALQALIAGADGATMAEKLTNAIDVRGWLDIWYEIVRPDGQVSRWTSKTGLSGGERRLVVLAPMLAAIAAYYDQLDIAGLRLAALDEVPAEVDERGREGLARYIAELDLDLICTSYLWDGAPGAWDGIDAWDLEAGPDTTVVAFPMLVRGASPLPGDPFEQPA